LLSKIFKFRERNLGKNNMENFKSNLAIFLVVLIGVGIGAYYIGLQQGLERGENIGRNAAIQEQEELSKKITTPAEINPVENLPETNPFKEAKTNPFEEGYKNPFK
jgi:hypothetical protein